MKKNRIAHTPKFDAERVLRRLQQIRGRLNAVRTVSTSQSPTKAATNQPSVPHHIPVSKQNYDPVKENSYTPTYNKPFEISTPEFPEEVETLIVGLRAISDIYTHHLPLKKRKIRPVCYGYSIKKNVNQEGN